MPNTDTRKKLLNQTVAYREHDRLDAVLRFELLHHVSNVKLDGALRLIEHASDFSSRKTIGKLIKNFVLFAGQMNTLVRRHRISWICNAMPLNMIVTCQSDCLEHRLVSMQPLTICVLASHPNRACKAAR